MYFNASISLPTYVEAKIVSVTEVTIVDPDKTVISNSAGANVNGSYAIHINLGNQRTTPLPGCDYPVLEISPSAASLDFPFACALSFENSHGLTTDNVFEVLAGYDNGKSACFILPKKLSTEDAKQLSTSEANLMLSVTLQDASKGAEYSSGLVDLKFKPSFVLEKRDVKLDSDGESVEIYGTEEMLQNLEVSVKAGMLSKVKGNSGLTPL